MKQLGTILLLFITVVQHSKAQTPEVLLRQQLDSISRLTGLAGFGVAVFSTDSLYFENGYGYADLENKKTYTTNTIQNIGSISKTFIGVALMKTIEMGKFNLDTPINDILPFRVVHPKYPEAVISVRHLATHTSGIVDFEKGYDRSYVLENPSSVVPENYEKDMEKYLNKVRSNGKMPLKKYLKGYLVPGEEFHSKKNFSKFAPGKRYVYSNIASALAAYCIEVVTGKSFPEFTQEHIFKKVGMHDTGWSYDSIDQTAHAKTYSNDLKALPKYSLVTYPDGGLRTSVASITRYLQTMVRCYQGEDIILKPESCQEMMKAQLAPSQLEDGEDTDNYGFFWEYNRETIIGHNGGDPGILTLMYYYKDIEMGAVFFTNTNVIDNPVASKQVQACWNAIRSYMKQLVDQKV